MDKYEYYISASLAHNLVSDLDRCFRGKCHGVSASKPPGGEPAGEQLRDRHQRQPEAG